MELDMELMLSSSRGDGYRPDYVLAAAYHCAASRECSLPMAACPQQVATYEISHCLGGDVGGVLIIAPLFMVLAEIIPKPVHVTIAGSSPTPRLSETIASLNLRPLHVYGLTETYGPITKGYYMPAWDSMPVRKGIRGWFDKSIVS